MAVGLTEVPIGGGGGGAGRVGGAAVVGVVPVVAGAGRVRPTGGVGGAGDPLVCALAVDPIDHLAVHGPGAAAGGACSGGLPLVTEEFSAGRLSYSQVRALCRWPTPPTRPSWVRLAQEMNADQLERMCRLLRGLDDQTDSGVADLVSMCTRWGEDGTATIRVRLPVDDAAVVTAAVEERVKRMGPPVEVPWEARRASALVELVADGARVVTGAGAAAGACRRPVG